MKYSPDEQIGVKEMNLLESALHRPKQSVLGKDAYPTIYEKAAALFHHWCRIIVFIMLINERPYGRLNTSLLRTAMN